MAVKPMRCEVTPNGCFICTSHKHNPDGYFRKGRSVEQGKPKHEMFHRTMWRHHGGEIPEGFEIDHLCKNRACFNVAHLRLIGVSEHKSYTNSYRYAGRKIKAKALWETGLASRQYLANEFNVSYATACNWIREWTS